LTDYPFPHAFDRARYKPLYLMRHLSESEVQAEIVSQLRALNVDAIAIDAGGKKTRGLMMARAKQQGRTFDPALLSTKTDLKGFPDLEATLAPEGRALYIEVKAPEWIEPTMDFGEKFRTVRKAHKPTEEQLAFLLAKHERGAIVLVAWSVTDVFDHAGAFIHRNDKSIRGTK
jgi:hypothetical protein